MAEGDVRMLIRYSNGSKLNAILLARTETLMRVVLQGDDDTVEFQQINGIWVSEDGHAVDVDFTETCQSLPVVFVDGLFCPPPVASRLLDLFFSGELEPEIVREVVANSFSTARDRVM
jgi:hypothetical protein